MNGRKSHRIAVHLTAMRIRDKQNDECSSICADFSVIYDVAAGKVESTTYIKNANLSN